MPTIILRLLITEKSFSDIQSIISHTPMRDLIRQTRRRGPSRTLCRGTRRKGDSHAHVSPARCSLYQRQFEELRETYPGLDWLGSFHVHPFGMPWLSGHDRRTVGKLFETPDLALSDFVAGIIQRTDRHIAVYPYVLYPDESVPWLMPLEFISEDDARRQMAINRSREVAVQTIEAQRIHAVCEKGRSPNGRIRRFWNRVNLLNIFRSQKGLNR